MFRAFSLRVMALTCVALISAAPARADEALVAVAANFAGAVEAIGAQYTRETGHSLKITTGSTGKLYAQIGEGAPFTILLSADARTPAKLEEEGKAVSGSQVHLCGGQAHFVESRCRKDRLGPQSSSDGGEDIFMSPSPIRIWRPMAWRPVKR